MIGIFDSGLGGLTALKEIRRCLPWEDLVYFGDTGRVPYGTRSAETITRYAMQDMRFLMSHRVDAVVVACGTVSSTALPALRAQFDVPVIGVVEGASESAAAVTKNKKVAVIGTAATVASRSYEACLRSLDPAIEVTAAACPLFVPLVEYGFTAPSDPILKLTCEKYLEPVRASGADTLILGCTHYPIIREAIALSLPGVTLINTGEAAAEKLCALLKNRSAAPDQTAVGRVSYYVSDDVAGFSASAERFLETDVSGSVERINIEAW